MEIRNKVTVTRGKGRGGNREEKGNGHSGTCIKDTWTKPNGVRLMVGGWDGWSKGP